MADETNDPRVPWPGEVTTGDWDDRYTAEDVLRWLASDGVAATAVSVDLLPPFDDRGDEVALGTYMLNVYRVMHTYDLHLALATLAEVDRAKADEVATGIVMAALAGDSYGEWLWEWATGHGLDAQAISDQARERVKADKAAPRSGADLIAAERRRQINAEGWTPEHDGEVRLPNTTGDEA